VTEVAEFKGKTMPSAFLINHGAHGYGKFVYDEATLKTLHTNLHKMKDKLDRKQTYLIMYDMIKSRRIAGARVLDVILKNIALETAEDVLQDCLRRIVPTIIGKYLPME